MGVTTGSMNQARAGEGVSRLRAGHGLSKKVCRQDGGPAHQSPEK